MWYCQKRLHSIAGAAERRCCCCCCHTCCCCCYFLSLLFVVLVVLVIGLFSLLLSCSRCHGVRCSDEVSTVWSFELTAVPQPRPSLYRNRAQSEGRWTYIKDTKDFRKDVHRMSPAPVSRMPRTYAKTSAAWPIGIDKDTKDFRKDFHGQ